MAIKFFVSGNYNNAGNGILDYLVDIQSPILSSYAYKNVLYPRIEILAGILRAQNKRIDHMIDSGAFTAWTSGKVIDLDQYCDDCNALQDKYSDCMNLVFVALDRIPGERGRERTPEDLSSACVESARNYDLMRQRVKGLVKPVFHNGDPDWLLAHYADSEYISYSMNQQLSEDARVAWVVNNREKAADKKLHGLAATGYKMMRAARWYSVDSAAWQYCASMGGINWVKPDGKLISLAISNESPRQKEFNGHYATLPKVYQELLQAEIAKEGLTIEGLASEYVSRWRWNIHCYHRACAIASTAPLIQIEQGLFE